MQPGEAMALQVRNPADSLSLLFVLPTQTSLASNRHAVLAVWGIAHTCLQMPHVHAML